MTPIISSLLDTDLYKFTMMQCVFHHYKEASAQYRFSCRRAVDLRPLKEKIEQQIEQLCQLTFSEDELLYLGSLPYIKKDFITFLRSFSLNRNAIELYCDDALHITIKGKWLDTILFEVPLLAIISECYSSTYYPFPPLEEGRIRLKDKLALLASNDLEHFRFSDFGTRRRFSFNWQEEVLQTLKRVVPTHLLGTSNVYLAKTLGLNPIGTMAHEYLQAFQQLSPTLKKCQSLALTTWLEEYHDELGIALTDTLTFDAFLNDFDKDLATRFSGLRQDSGDPYQWGEKAIAHYESLNVSPRQKIFVFSDSLTFPKAIALYKHFNDRCQPTFGIGTNLTNDLGVPPLDIVIKMTHTNDKPVVKLSDSPGKMVSVDPAMLNRIKTTFDIKD